MTSARPGTTGSVSEPTGFRKIEGGVPAAPSKISGSRATGRSGRRAEDTGAGCRANAAADLARARAPGGDYMRERLETSAAVWTERAGLLERLEEKFKRRTLAG